MVKALPPGKGGQIAPLEIWDEPLTAGQIPKGTANRGRSPFPESDEDRDENFERQWRNEGKGGANLEKIVNGNGGNGAPNGGPGPDGKGKSKKKGSKSKILHYAKEGLMYGTVIPAFARYKYREHVEEGRLAEPRARQTAGDILSGIQSDPSKINHYTVLGIDTSATVDTITKAWRAKAKVLHPDINPSQEASDALILVNEAYQVLKDPRKRAAYDESLKGEQWEDLPGSYRRKLRSQARGQLRTEKEVFSEARKLGIPIEESVMKTYDNMSEAERKAVRDTLGHEPKGSAAKIPMPISKRRKSVADLTKEIESHKGTVATTRATRGAAESVVREILPSKKVKAIRGAKATVQWAKDKGGSTPIAARVRTGGAGTSQLRVTQSASDSIKSMGLGGSALRTAVGTSSRLRTTESKGRLTRAGGAATSRRSAFGSGQRQLSKKF